MSAITEISEIQSITGKRKAETEESVKIFFEHMEVNIFSASLVLAGDTTTNTACLNYVKQVALIEYPKACRKKRYPFYKDLVTGQPIDMKATIAELLQKQRAKRLEGPGPLDFRFNRLEISVIESVWVDVTWVRPLWQGHDNHDGFYRPEAKLDFVLKGMKWFKQINPLDCRMWINGKATLTSDVLRQEVKYFRLWESSRPSNPVYIKFLPNPVLFSLAFMMGTHERLGKDFSLSGMEDAVLRTICEMAEIDISHTMDGKF